ncbi:class I SAM-dependent methyltransferase [Candidatus Woesearchaeota archaeon]|nr:MAG: class I SAM-dependent methyltransferase [Candidatus Woesearchaeota archaeon]
MPMTDVSSLYEKHHELLGKSDYSMLEDERGKLFASWIGTGKKVLDIGCRDGTLTRHFLSGNDVTGVDIDRQMLARAEKLGIKTKLLDLHGTWDLPQFDVIVAAEVLEHLYYPHDICKKIADHLKPGGLFIGSVPNAYNIKNRLRYLFGIQKNTPLDDPTHINQFSYKLLRALLQKHFSSVELSGIAGGKMNAIAKRVPNLGSFMLVWRATR